MTERPAPVEVVELEDRIVPDNSFEEAYAIYLRLSCEPSLEWEEAFQRFMEEEPRRRIVSFIGDRLRVVISRKDNLEMVLRQVAALARRTNVKLDYTGDGPEAN